MKIEDCTKDRINQCSEQIFKAYGVNLKNGRGICPFHDDKTPSFVAKPDGSGRWKWKCLACDTKGSDIFSFVAQMENLNIRTHFVEVVRQAAKICGLGHLVSDDESEAANKENDTASIPKENKTPKRTQSKQPPRYLNAEVRQMAQEVEQTNLYKFLCRIWEESEVKRVMEAYAVGRGHYINAPRSKFNTSDDWQMNPNPCCLQNSLACNSFPSMDIDGNCHAVKIIPYPINDHHRIKEAQPSKPSLYWIKPETNKGAYFGTHLLPHRPNAPVAIVESEKSAIIGSLFAPQYIWIATQSKGLLSAESASVEVLKGREIHLFPDADAVQSWSDIADQLRVHGYRVVFRDEVIKLLPAESKADIADVIIWEMERGGSYGV